MKKILLGTTALLGAAALATAANAAPAVNVGGSIDFQAGFADQDSVFETGANSRDIKFQNDTEVHVGVEGKASNGLTYGAVIELEADVTADADGEGLNADKTYTYIESGFGRVELGNNSGAAQALRYDSSRIARATGGTDGDWYDFVNLNGATGTANFIAATNLPLEDAAGATEDATKISYYTPRFSGFQAGASFTPDTGNAGSAAGFTSDTNGDYENAFDLGLTYENTFNNVGVNASATGSFGESESAATEDLSAYAFGLGLSYQGFSVAGSFGEWDDSGLAVALPAGAEDDQNYWDVGVAYEHGPFGVSATYLQSDSVGDELDLVSIGADYELAPGLTPYIEANFYDADEDGTTVDNDGTVVLAGTQLNF